MRAALTRLAPNAVIEHLALPDGHLVECNKQLYAALTSLTGSASTLLVTPWSADGHPDHEACGHAAARLAEHNELIEHWQYSIWYWHWATPGDDTLPAGFRRLDRSEQDRPAKYEALAGHVSQHRPLSEHAGDEAILPPGVLTHFERSFECFIVDPAVGKPAYFEKLYEHSEDPWDSP